ncbi:MAG: DUF4288 domain-containing protein [Pseudomonadota bacterium]|nr:DUF4288 domain-containing protein [Pseudomonadota bacterium]
MFEKYDKKTSPVGWYVASYLLRFVEIEDPKKDDLDQRFLSWENSVLIQATSIQEAFDKVVKIALAETRPYKGGAQAADVQWIFEGVTEILPIYETLADGSEIMWCERFPRKLKNLRRLVIDRKSLDT